MQNATQPGALGSRGLYGLFWQLRGGECSVRTDFGLQDTSAGSALGESLACDLGIEGGDITKVLPACFAMMLFSSIDGVCSSVPYLKLSLRTPSSSPQSVRSCARAHVHIMLGCALSPQLQSGS